MARRWIAEHHTIKILMEPRGAIVGFTMKRYSYLLFVSRRFFGIKRVRTQDRVVARGGYSTPQVLELISTLYPQGA